MRNTLVSIPYASAPASERLPPDVFRFTTASRMACSPGQFVASMTAWSGRTPAADPVYAVVAA